MNEVIELFSLASRDRLEEIAELLEEMRDLALRAAHTEDDGERAKLDKQFQEMKIRLLQKTGTGGWS